MTPPPIVLIGPMASGKSAIGQELAAQLGVTFSDTDRIVTKAHGPIAEIFARYGERFFRHQEAAALQRLLESEEYAGTVISVGGGAVLDTGTSQLLSSSAVVVYLVTDLATVMPRISGKGHRPLLAEDPVTSWVRLFDLRRPVYERLADLTLDTRRGNVRELAARLKALLQERNYLQ
ncbi:shikimate kinase [Arthrobacter pigmenti]